MIPEWLQQRTFVLQYNPVCFKKYMVRLIGVNGKDSLDNALYYDGIKNDAFGFGDSIEDAAKNALVMLEEQKRLG